MLFAPFSAASTHSYTAKCTQEINFKDQPQNRGTRLLYILHIVKRVSLGLFGKMLLQWLLVYFLLSSIVLLVLQTATFCLHIFPFNFRQEKC